MANPGGSAIARLLGLWVCLNFAGIWLSVSRAGCVLSGRGLCDGVDHLSGGILSSAVLLSVILKPRQ